MDLTGQCGFWGHNTRYSHVKRFVKRHGRVVLAGVLAAVVAGATCFFATAVCLVAASYGADFVEGYGGAFGATSSFVSHSKYAGPAATIASGLFNNPNGRSFAAHIGYHLRRLSRWF